MRYQSFVSARLSLLLALVLSTPCAAGETDEPIRSQYLSDRGNILGFLHHDDAYDAFEGHSTAIETHRSCDATNAMVCIEGPRVALYIPLSTPENGYPDSWEHGDFQFEKVADLGVLESGRYVDVFSGRVGGMAVRRTQKRGPKLPVLYVYFYGLGLLSFQEAHLVTDKERACSNERQKGCHVRTRTWFLVPGSPAIGAASPKP